MRIPLVIIVCAAVVAALTLGCNAVSKEAAIKHYVAGKLFADKGDAEKALAELAEAVRINPSLGIAHAAAGDIHRKQGNHELARQSYEKSCQANPYAFRPHYNLGLTYQRLAHAAKAVKKVRDFLGKAVKTYVRAVTLDPDDFDTNLNLSACYFQLGKYDLAEKYCTSALGINPEDPHVHSNLGIIYDSQDKLYEAINAYKASLELDTNQPKLLVNLGSTYMRQQRLKKAIKAFGMACEMDPSDADPWEQLGSCHYRMKEYSKAQTAYQKALSLNGSSCNAYRGLGVVYMTMFILDQEDTELRELGLSAWHSSLELDPEQEDLRKFVRKYTPRYRGPEL